MGILDDAIREHLELKRQHGAEPGDLARLEKEAFGPSTRPGDEPSFASEADEEPGDEQPTELVEADAPRTEVSAEQPPEDDDEPDSELDTDPGSGILFDHLEDDPFADIGEVGEGSDETPAQRARIEHSELQDTIDHPAVGAAEPTEPPESAIFDSEIGEEELPLDEIDLDLDTDPVAPEPPAPADPASAAASADPAPPTPAEPDFGEDEFDLSLEEEEALEQPAPEPSRAPDPPVEDEPAPSPEPPVEDEPMLPPEPPAESAPDGEEEEDLLEETPEFLEGAPEGERLWFEQGEPKDFDF